ncbi:MAG: putative periplasmic ligand-binding sensor domain protein, partial [Bacteroidetes bacterium]|nr:putative periplasmic ligand-binding sensor domain protein [Bacteroidota bacterium]
PDSTNPESLSNATAYYIYGDAGEAMWIATDYGINKYNPETNGFIHYVHDEKDTNSVIINEILTFYEDSENRMWVGTFSGGLDLFDRKKNRFTHFNSIKELSDAVIYGIFEDGKSNLWMSTNNGIIQFNPQTRFIKQYTIEDGLQSNEFNGGAYFLASTVFFLIKSSLTRLPLPSFSPIFRLNMNRSGPGISLR